MKLTLGLDIGIASVGWGIIDEENGRIIDCGVRLFDAASADNNAERRSNRQARRLTRRRKHRLERIQQLLENNQILRPEIFGEMNPYQVRVKGLTEKLNKDELYIALYNLAKRRGISYLDDVESDQKMDHTLQINRELLETLHPCQIQLERFEKYGQVRGFLSVKNEETGETEQFVNIFPTSKYISEATEILEKQIELGLDVEKNFINKYTNILAGKREYFIGPGNEKSRSDYGIYKTDGNTLDNLFETLIGKCTIYPDKYRAARASYTAQEFNMLNELNNLTVDGRKLTIEEKKKIIQAVHTSKKLSSIVKIICKVAGCDEAEISGAPTDQKKGKIQFQSFEIYRKMLKEFKVENLDASVLTREAVDELGRILTLNTESQAIRDRIAEEDGLKELTKEMVELLVKLRKKNATLFSGWHSLSLKAMNEIIPELWETDKNQMQLFTERGVFKARKETLKQHNTIPTAMIADEIYNPIVRKSVRQAIKIVNALIKKYGVLDNIVIEMPRDNHPEKQKRKIATAQKKNKNEKDEALARAKEEYFFTDEVFRGQKDLKLKIRLWYQQDQRCIYSGEKISVRDLVLTPNQFEVDHIIPKSISFNDSLNNKVICLAEENQNKGQKTPYQYLKGKATYNEFKARVLRLFKDGKISGDKKDFLLEEADIDKWEVRQRFISRNLNDTRYASKTVLNAIQDYMIVHEKKTKVFVIRGQFTAQLRRRWNFKKNREETSAHHGIDALVVAAANGLDLWKKGSLFAITENGLVHKETGEILPVLNDKDYDQLVYAEPFANFLAMLVEEEKRMKFSYKVDRKVNRKVSDATIYSTRNYDGEDYIIGKISNIYDDKSYERFKGKYIKDKSQFLMCQHDPQTFAILESAMHCYADAKNPFRAYKEEHGEPLRKYSKSGKGPFVFDLKYKDTKLGVHMDISDKNKNVISDKKKTVLLSLKSFRTDVYYNPTTKRYGLVGVKHNMFKFSKGRYILDMESYNQEKMEKEKLGNDYEFIFSLYRNDLFLWEKSDGTIEVHRFLSKDESGKNRIGIKPIEKPKHEKTSNPYVTKNIVRFEKINSDILGGKHFISKESFKTEYEI